ncbi:MAG: hypothetical protein H6Q18_42 [Bacteroidetes bacterium]|nr:hypothetical protein [Bacteroidota bacterium]
MKTQNSYANSFIEKNFTKSNWQMGGIFLMDIVSKRFLLVDDKGHTWLFDQYPFTAPSSMTANLSLAIAEFKSLQDAVDFLMIQ